MPSGLYTGEQRRGIYRYIHVYPSKSVYLTNFYVVTGCFFSLTQDKFDIMPVCALARVSFTYLHTTIYTPPPQMKFLATYAPRYTLGFATHFQLKSVLQFQYRHSSHTGHCYVISFGVALLRQPTITRCAMFCLVFTQVSKKVGSTKLFVSGESKNVPPKHGSAPNL